VRVAEHPAGAVHVEDHRKRAGSALRLDDPDFDRAGRSALDVDPLFVDLGLEDRGVLDAVDRLAAILRSQLVEERRGGCGVDELLGGRLQGEVLRVTRHSISPSRFFSERAGRTGRRGCSDDGCGQSLGAERPLTLLDGGGDPDERALDVIGSLRPVSATALTNNCAAVPRELVRVDRSFLPVRRVRRWHR
jgi:hypothetical protein